MSTKMIDTTIRNLSDYLDNLEVRVMEDTNMSHTNGGYCNAEHDGHDEEYIYIKVVWGVNLPDEHYEHHESYKIAINVLSNPDLTFGQKYAKMEDCDGYSG